MIQFWREHTGFVLITVGLEVGFFVADWRPALLVSGVLLVVWAVTKWIRVVDADHHRKIAEMQQLEQRADYEVGLWNRDDPRGMYGQYQPRI